MPDSIRPVCGQCGQELPPLKLSRREMFDALPIHIQAALPTWPLPTYEHVRFVYDRWCRDA